MLKLQFDPKKRYRVAIYLRMSSDSQNPRSPQQQLREIKKRLKQLGYRWVIVKIYTDDAISGRYLRRRKAYQQMMRDIASGAIAIDLILADTIERFGRVDQLDEIRRNLQVRHGVLVLCADSNFCDPLSPQGQALALFETMRATQDGRIKAHNVLRGKIDAALEGHWPGGMAPLGYKLKSIMKTVSGREEVDYSIPIPDPVTAPVVQLLFKLARDTGYGVHRLTRLLNDHPDVPDAVKPLCSSTVGDQLDNPLYYGELVFNTHSTGIVDDSRVVQLNPQEDWVRVPDVCEPLVSKELWMEVQALREARRSRKSISNDDGNGKQLAPTAPGMTVNYLLSGLLYCALCGIRMTLSSSTAYANKEGVRKKYAFYLCPRSHGGQCENRVRVPEAWIREQVVDVIRRRLFPWR